MADFSHADLLPSEQTNKAMRVAHAEIWETILASRELIQESLATIARADKALAARAIERHPESRAEALQCQNSTTQK